MDLTTQQFIDMLGCEQSVADAWCPAFNSAMARCSITTPNDKAAFLANVAIESRNLEHLEENLNYSTVVRLLEIFGHHITVDEAPAFLHNPEKLANRVYANREGNGDEASGDGYTYRARGPLGVTFKNNYMLLGQEIGVDLIEHPEKLKEPYYGAWSAALYWQQHGCSVRANKGDFDGCCDMVNIGHKTQRIGDANDYNARRARWLTNRRILHIGG